MIFVVLTFIAAFLIEGLGTLVSVIGLSTLFGANPIIIALAIALDIGKLVVVSLLYTHWKELTIPMKAYALVASAVTMIITSAGAAGYLSGEFQKAILGTQEISLKVDVLKQEQAKLEQRKKQIDDSIAAIPDRYSASQKIRLMNQYKDEQKQVTARLGEISKELPSMQINQIGVEAKAGPILYVAKAFDVPVEVAVKYVILLIIFVFDPLAVFLIIAGNFLLSIRRQPPEPSKHLSTEPDHGSPRVIPHDQPATTTGVVEAPAPQPVEAPTPPVIHAPSAAPVTPEVRSDQERETITLEQLRGASQKFGQNSSALTEENIAEAAAFRSSLNDVQVDDTLTFDPNPRNTTSRTQYMNYDR